MKFYVKSLLAFAAAAAFSSATYAAPVVYVFQSVGSGSFGGVSFNNATITTTATGDTSNVFTDGSGFIVNPVTASVKIDGFSATSFTDAFQLLAVPTSGIFAADPVTNRAFTFISGSSALGYNLSNNLSISGPTVFDGTIFSTIAGSLQIFGSDGSTTGTLNAIVSPVPEPSIWAMMVLGFGVAGCVIRRRHRVTVRVA